MVIQHIIIIIVENMLIGLILGASTLAVVSYGISLRYGYPRDGVGRTLIQSVYKILRISHILYFTLAIIIFLLFGVLDGIQEAFLEYGIKISILIINAIIAYGMTKGYLKVQEFAPIIAAGWYFLASFHSFTLFVILESVLIPLIVFTLYIVVFQIIFLLLRKFVKKIEN